MNKERLIISGFSAVEVLLASSVFILIVTALTGAYLYGRESTVLAGNRARAVFLAEEGIEAVRNIRDVGFTNLTDGTYGLATTSNEWNLSLLPDTNDIFSRQITIASIDAKRKSVTATVSWQQNLQRAGSVALVTELSNWIATAVSNWANATSSASIDIAGNNNGLKVQVAGTYVYMVRNGGTPNFLVIDVTSPDSPSIVGTLSLSGTPTNIAVAGNYAYVSNGNNSQELQIVDVSIPSAPNLAGTYNAPGGANPLGVFVSGTKAYLVRVSSGDDEFVVIDVTSPSSPSLLGSLNLGATGNEVVVSGQYAYIASASGAQEVQVVDVSSPSAPSLVGSGVNLPGNTDATTIALSGSLLFVGQGSSFRVVSVSNPLLPTLVGSLATGGLINDIALTLGGGSLLFIASSDTGGEFTIIDVNTPAAPTLLTQFNVIGNNPLLGAAYDTTLDRAFMVGQSNAEEFMVFRPQ